MFKVLHLISIGGPVDGVSPRESRERLSAAETFGLLPRTSIGITIGVAAGTGNPCAGCHWRERCVEEFLAEEHVVSEGVFSDGDFTKRFAVSQAVRGNFEVEGIVDEDCGTIRCAAYGAGVVAEGYTCLIVKFNMVVTSDPAYEHIVCAGEDNTQGTAVRRDVTVPRIGGDSSTANAVHGDSQPSSLLFATESENRDVGEDGSVAMGRSDA
jgi:hypothetical protein